MKPTYLYIKQHSATGVKYFGKTTQPDPIKYMGSGLYWKRHINKYGKEYVKTLWYKLYTNKSELTNTALALSEMFDIVESDSWANIHKENGLDGGPVGAKRTLEQCQHMSKVRTGLKLRPRSQESRDKMKGNTHTLGKKIHSDKRKIELSNLWKTNANPGKNKSDETKTKIALAGIGNTNAKGSKRTAEQNKRNSERQSKTHYMIDPTGNNITIVGMRSYCLKNSLNISHMCAVSAGREKQYKGWTKQPIELED